MKKNLIKVNILLSVISLMILFRVAFNFGVAADERMQITDFFQNNLMYGIMIVCIFLFFIITNINNLKK